MRRAAGVRRITNGAKSPGPASASARKRHLPRAWPRMAQNGPLLETCSAERRVIEPDSPGRGFRILLPPHHLRERLSFTPTGPISGTAERGGQGKLRTFARPALPLRAGIL